MAAAKAKKTVDSDDEDDKENDDTFHSSGFEIIASEDNCVALQVLRSAWLEYPSLNQRLTLQILLPSGNKPSDATALVENGCTEVCVTIVWPAILHNPMAFSNYIVGRNNKPIYGEDHPQTVGFQNSIRELQRGRKSMSSITSTFRIPLGNRYEEQFHENGKHRGVVYTGNGDGHLFMTVFLIGMRDNYMVPDYAAAGIQMFASPTITNRAPVAVSNVPVADGNV